jgi:hypothetical protein
VVELPAACSAQCRNNACACVGDDKVSWQQPAKAAHTWLLQVLFSKDKEVFHSHKQAGVMAVGDGKQWHAW